MQKQKKQKRGRGDFFAAWGCIVIGTILLALMAPSLLRDFLTDAETLEPAPEYRVSKARCDRQLFVFNSCDFTFVHRKTSEKLRFDYMFFGRLDDGQVIALTTPDKGYVTTNVGMENLQNRNMMLTVLCGFFLFGGAFLLWQKRKR